MSQPDSPQPRYGRERVCPQCGTRVAQKARSCFFCGAPLDGEPRQPLRVPWADFVLFTVIAAVFALWWLRAPETPDVQQIASNNRQGALATALSAATPTVQPTALPPTPTPTETRQPTPTILAAPLRHVVKSGDTVAAIAEKYGSTIKDIIQANGLGADGRLNVGRELVIPLAGPTGGLGPTATPSGGSLVYTVQSGDTISDIALKYGSQIDWILSANKMKPTDFLRIGQSLTIPLSPATPTIAPTPVVALVTPTVPAVPERALAAPSLLAPANAAALSGQAVVLLTWTAVGTLEETEFYVVTLRRPDRTMPVATFWTKGTTWRLQTQYRGDATGITYTWNVQVRAGSAEQPGKTMSPPSETRHFTWK